MAEPVADPPSVDYARQHDEPRMPGPELRRIHRDLDRPLLEVQHERWPLTLDTTERPACRRPGALCRIHRQEGSVPSRGLPSSGRNPRATIVARGATGRKNGRTPGARRHPGVRCPSSSAEPMAEAPQCALQRETPTIRPLRVRDYPLLQTRRVLPTRSRHSARLSSVNSA